eukprot:CAMPEP_0115144902 /NCGR_PEP_ID=MMETSP0227-20121206/61793_1 /TAXON_ID=89957 /ORGANISM="Polarella glacialis, Strain CCMP 1383" /LENGTH=673 /DNA_ID=CAMNT_0002554311 /DNA_START=111 /DNA_END=2134 /DNA_ORIENTATION=-
MTATSAPQGCQSGQEWSPPAGDWLARNGGSSHQFGMMADKATSEPALVGEFPAELLGNLSAEPPSNGALPGPTAAAQRHPWLGKEVPAGPATWLRSIAGACQGLRLVAVAWQQRRCPRTVRLQCSAGRLPASAATAPAAVALSGSRRWRDGGLCRQTNNNDNNDENQRYMGSQAAPTSCAGPPAALPVSPSAAAGAIASGKPLPGAPAVQWQSFSLVQPVQPAPASRAEASNKEALAAMAARLSQVERLNQHQAAKLAKLSQEADALRAENRILRRFSDLEDDELPCEEEADAGSADGLQGTSSAEQQEMTALRTERDSFKQQCRDMLKFLGDYGLNWVGDSEKFSEESGEEAASEPPRGGADAHGTVASRLSRPRPSDFSCTVDIQVVTAKVEGLNATVEKEGARIVRDRVGGAVHARLVADDAPPLPLCFFKDGVKLGGRDFQMYSSRPAQLLLRDILDGFFPYALKNDFPDGVMLKVVDRTGYDFTTWLRDHPTGDKELTDGGDRLALVGVRASGGGANGSLCSAAERVPEKFVRNGLICEVRGPEELLRGGNAGARGNSAPAGPCNRSSASGEVSLLHPDRDPTAPLARLQVKLDGLRLVLCMEPTHTIGNLEDALEKWCSENSHAGLKGSHLRTPFPPQTFTDRDQSLADAGLTPSATLFVAVEPSPL